MSRWRKFIARIVAVSLSLLPLAAFGQQFPVVGPNTVIGRIGNGQSGPAQQIPFSMLFQQVGLAPADGTTLTISSAMLSVNLAHANTWTGVQTFPNNSLTLAEFPTIGPDTVLGSIAGGTPIALTKAQLTSLINLATASLSGAFPAYGSLTTGSCANGLALNASNAPILMPCTGSTAAVAINSTGVTGSAGSNRLHTSGTVTAGTGTLEETSATADSSGNLAGVNSLAGSVIATKAEQVAATSATNVVTPSTQQNHPSALKAWVHFGSCTTSPCTLGDSYNVSSVTRTSTGVYTMNVTTSFANANYSCSGTAGSIGVSGLLLPAFVSAQTVAAFQFDTVTLASPAVADFTNVNVMCTGTQ
jgi:hypothetical protein